MSIHDERDLRDQLGAALGGLEAGPLPLAAVVRQGRMVMIRKRVAVAACVAVLAVAAVAAPTLAREIGKPGPATGGYRITISAPGRGDPKDTIAIEHLGKQRLRLFGQWEGGGHHSWCLGVRGQAGCGGGGPNRGRLSAPIVSFVVNFGRRPEVFFGSVRDDVTRLRLDLSNGQAVMLRPIKVFGQKYAGYVGFALPGASDVVRITAYSAHGEIGYEIPFTGFESITTPIMLKPGQPALPRPHTYLLGSGSARNWHWKEHLYVGPWGSCVGGAGGFICEPRPAAKLVGNVLANAIFYSILPGRHGVVVFAVATQVSYLRISPKDGSAFTARCINVAGARMCTAGWLPPDRWDGGRWTAYSADGTELGSGNMP